jgi:hypothetical protein
LPAGATVPFNTQASIAPADGSFSPEKNPAFFVFSGDHALFQDEVRSLEETRALAILRSSTDSSASRVTNDGFREGLDHPTDDPTGKSLRPWLAS